MIRLARWFALAVAVPGGLWFCTTPVGGRAMLSWLDRLSPEFPVPSCPSADAIAVLSGDGPPRSEPWPAGRRLSRSEAGIQLFRAGKAPQLIFLEGGVEAEQSREAALRAGLPPDRVLLYGSAQDTAQEAELIAAGATRSGWKRVILVTSGYHIRRARLLVQQSANAKRWQLTVISFPADSGKFLLPMPGSREYRPSLAGAEIAVRAAKELAGPLICRLGLC